MNNSARLRAKRQLGPKYSTTSRPSAQLIACTEAGALLTDSWGEGLAGTGVLPDAGCRMRAVYSALLIRANNCDPQPFLSGKSQPSVHFRDSALSCFVSGKSFQKFNEGVFCEVKFLLCKCEMTFCL